MMGCFICLRCFLIALHALKVKFLPKKKAQNRKIACCWDLNISLIWLHFSRKNSLFLFHFYVSYDQLCFYLRMPWTLRNVLHTHNICFRCFFIALHAFEKQGLNKKALKITKLHLVEISIYHWFEYKFWEKFAFPALFHFYVSYDQNFLLTCTLDSKEYFAYP